MPATSAGMTKELLRGRINMHKQGRISRRYVLQMASAVAGLALSGTRAGWAQAQPQMPPRIEKLAPELDNIIAATEPIKELASGFGGPLGPAEGPLWWKEGGYLLFTDIHNNRRMKYTPGKGVSVDLEPTNRANGLTRDLQGRLLSCEHDTRRVTRRELDGGLTVLANSFQGRRLKSAQRRGGEVGRRDLFDRPLDVADAAGAVGPHLCRRLSAHSRSRHLHAAGRELRPAQRNCLLARRKRALRQ